MAMAIVTAMVMAIVTVIRTEIATAVIASASLLITANAFPFNPIRRLRAGRVGRLLTFELAPVRFSLSEPFLGLHDNRGQHQVRNVVFVDCSVQAASAEVMVQLVFACIF